MNPFGRIEIGMSGTHTTVVTDELTVGHFVAGPVVERLHR